jgi:hypothetical protein
MFLGAFLKRRRTRRHFLMLCESYHSGLRAMIAIEEPARSAKLQELVLEYYYLKGFGTAMEQFGLMPQGLMTKSLPSPFDKPQ